MSKVNRDDLDKHIAAKFDMPESEAEDIIVAVFDWIKSSAAETGEVDLYRFGTFEVRQGKAYTSRNPKTGEPVQVPAKNRVKFRPFKAFRDAVL